MRRRDRIPHAVHLGRITDADDVDHLQTIVLSMALPALERAEGRREQLGVPAGTYWPTVMIAVGVTDEVPLLLDALGERLPLDGLAPFVRELKRIRAAARTAAPPL